MTAARGEGERRRAAPGFAACLARAGLDRLDALSSRALGEVITDHRRSWVRRAQIDTIDSFIKTYDYPTVIDRLRGALRTTLWAASRAEREWRALLWMRSHGFPAPEPLAVLERRRGGMLHRAVLVTRAHAGEPLDRLLPRLGPAERDAVLRAVEGAVEALHRAGFRDRNLDLRNLLAHRTGTEGWQIAKLDSPRHRIVRPGPAHDRAARADWERLARSVTAAGLAR